MGSIVDNTVALQSLLEIVNNLERLGIAIESVSESTADGGVNVVTFSDGTTLSVKNGTKGTTPVKGIDYWTEAERAALIAEVIESVIVQYPEAHVIYGDIDQSNVITLYSDDKLPTGIYTLNFKMNDGTLQAAGQIVISGEAVEELEPVSLRWIDGAGINSSTALINGADTCTMTDFVFVEPNTQYSSKVSGLSSNQRVYARYYNSQFAYIGSANLTSNTTLTEMVFPDNTAAFRLHCEDSSGSFDGFHSGVSIVATKLSNTIALSHTNTIGIKLDKTTGAEGSDTNYAASDYIAIDASASEYKLICYSKAECAVSVNCFDANKTQVGYLANIISESVANPEVVALSLPDNTKYIRLRVYLAGNNSGTNAISVCCGTSVIKV